MIEKQVYKLKLFINEKIYNIFYILLLEQDIMRKKQGYKNNNLLEPKKEFQAKNNKKL